MELSRRREILHVTDVLSCTLTEGEVVEFEFCFTLTFINRDAKGVEHFLKAWHVVISKYDPPPKFLKMGPCWKF